MYVQEVDVVREIMEDSRFKGKQHYRFEAELNKDGVLLLGGKGKCRCCLSDWTDHLHSEFHNH